MYSGHTYIYSSLARISEQYLSLASITKLVLEGENSLDCQLLTELSHVQTAQPMTAQQSLAHAQKNPGLPSEGHLVMMLKAH
jgi:hypothetical protein